MRGMLDMRDMRGLLEISQEGGILWKARKKWSKMSWSGK